MMLTEKRIALRQKYYQNISPRQVGEKWEGKIKQEKRKKISNKTNLRENDPKPIKNKYSNHKNNNNNSNISSFDYNSKIQFS